MDCGNSVEVITQVDLVHGPYHVIAVAVSPGEEAASIFEIVELWVSVPTAVPDGCANVETTSHACLMLSCPADYAARPARCRPYR